MKEHVTSVPWGIAPGPRSFLAMRFHAIGDAALIIPYLACLRRLYPLSIIDVLTSTPVRDLFEALPWISSVQWLETDRGPFARGVNACRVGLEVRKRMYDVILDLQRNWTSRLIRRIANPRAFSEFERFVRQPASTRVNRAFAAAEVGDITPDFEFPISLTCDRTACELLRNQGWDGLRPLVVLNPAGLWITRQWPAEHYAAVAREIVRKFDGSLLFLGTDRVSGIAKRISSEFPQHTIDLSNQTTLGVALAVLRRCTAMITEDSGLMHMAWAVGLPLVALFGSSCHEMSGPTGDRSVLLDSGDLECGSCMSPLCRFGDVHCLSRRTPDAVMAALESIVTRLGSKESDSSGRLESQ